MSQIIRCYTLFDITQTNVSNRARPPEDVDKNQWLRKRNQQCNFDTILQIISMRSQPDLINFPTMNIMNLANSVYFGKNYTKEYKVWHFDFEIHHEGVFDDGQNIFGYLYKDCEGVPMIEDLDKNITSFLYTTPETKNIHFEKL